MEWDYCKEKNCKYIETERECLKALDIVTTSSSIQLNVNHLCQNKNCIVVLYTQTYKCLQYILCQEFPCENFQMFVSSFFKNCQVANSIYEEMSEYLLSPLTENTLYKIYIIQVLHSETIGSAFRMNIKTQPSKLLIPGTIKLISRTSTSIKLKWNSTKDLNLDSKIYRVDVELLNNGKRSNILESDTLQKLESCTKYCFKLNAYYYLEKYYTSESCFYTSPDNNIDILEVYNNTAKWSYYNSNRCSVIFEGEYTKKNSNNSFLTFKTDKNMIVLINLESQVLYLVRIRISMKIERHNIYYGPFTHWVEFSSILSHKTSSNIVSLSITCFLIIVLPCFILMALMLKIKHKPGCIYNKFIKSNYTNGNVEKQFYVVSRNKKPVQLRSNQTDVKLSRIETNFSDRTNSINIEETFPILEPRWRNNAVGIKDFSNYYLKISANNSESILQEYKKLTLECKKMEKELKLTVYTGKSSENYKKNRFVNILPFDQSRVILKRNSFSNDYINANYIPFSNDKDNYEYIASQGPIEHSIEDFWEMISNENVNCIIMLTRTREENKFKCLQYWPENIGEEQTYGHNSQITVILEEETETEAYIERILFLKDINTQDERRIIHLQMHTWFDHSAPNLEYFDKFLFRFHEVNNSLGVNPYLIHCSAGIGRTGTLICIDRIIKQLISGSMKINIYDTVLTLRQYRNFMVQRQAQYVFIHDYIDHFLKKYIKIEEETLYFNEDD